MKKALAVLRKKLLFLKRQIQGYGYNKDDDYKKTVDNGIVDIEEAIKELEELNNRSCKDCIHFTIYKGEYGVCKRGFNNRRLDLLHNSFYCNIHESKD